jgi:hypothetical protein
VLSVRHCKLDLHRFGEFCQDLTKNTTFVRLNFGHNPLCDDGSAQFAPVLAQHPALHEIDFELYEIGDGGAEALLPALAQSQRVGRFSVKNNLIRGGLPIQKAVSDNSGLLTLNVDLTNIDFKGFIEIYFGSGELHLVLKSWRSINCRILPTSQQYTS